jgi:hypothetical protein
MSADRIHHLSPSEKTTAIILLAEALQAATLVGNPAPIVVRLRQWMDAPPEVGDLVVEMSTRHRGPSNQRVGTVNDVRHSRRHHDTIVEILVVDPPCGNDACTDRMCIHRPRWSNATFVRIPATPAQLDQALERRTAGPDGVDRDGLIATLADAGIRVRGT